MPVKVYDGTNWVTVAGDGQQGAASSSSIVTWVKTASGGETSLSGNDDNSQPLSYTAGQELLYINGVLQKRAVDYVATTGTTITGLNALTASDVVTVWTVNAFSVTNAISNSLLTATGDTIYASSVNTPARLGVGSSGQVLTVSGGVPTWGGALPKLSFVSPTANFTTTSTSYVDVTGYTITITPVSATNTIQVTANLAVQLGTSSNTEFKLLVDGVNVGGRIEAPLEATEGSITVIGYVSNLAASAKVCKLQMRAAGGVSTTVYGSSSGYVSNFGVLEVY